MESINQLKYRNIKAFKSFDLKAFTIAAVGYNFRIFFKRPIENQGLQVASMGVNADRRDIVQMNAEYVNIVIGNTFSLCVSLGIDDSYIVTAAGNTFDVYGHTYITGLKCNAGLIRAGCHGEISVNR
jgi:hypothetical protein